MTHEGEPSLRLIAIPVSHYCEKARWALERAALPYREIRHLQFVHYASTLLHARSWYAPVLLTPHGPIPDSTAILQFVDSHVAPRMRLFPPEQELAAEVARWEDLFDTTVGVEARRWMYHVGFEQLGDARMLAIAAQGVPRWQETRLRPFLPLVKAYIRWRLQLTSETVERGLELLQDVFERVGADLADGRPYLVADRFTAADLTFASLAALILMPAEYGVRLPDVSTLPDPMRRTVERFRAMPAGQFALRLYAQERRIDQQASLDRIRHADESAVSLL
jgi:glutathione S-transferase